MLHEGTRSNLSGSLAETGSFSKDSWKGWRPGSWDTWLHDMWRCLIPPREFMRIQQLQVGQKEGFARKNSFWRWVSAVFYHCSLILFKLKYDIPADAHWNLEPIPISAERVPSPTYHTIYWSISGMDRSIASTDPQLVSLWWRRPPCRPGMFVFVPHGWWHAVRPIDDFTFITGPSQLSNLGVSAVSWGLKWFQILPSI